MATTHKFLINYKPKTLPDKQTIGDALYLWTSETGSRSFRRDYRFAGKRKTYTFGKFPDELSLAEAKQRNAELASQLAQGLDPNEIKKQKKFGVRSAADNSFEVVARDWFETNFKASGNTEAHETRTIRRLELHVFPYVGSVPISELCLSFDLISERVVKRLVRTDNLDTAGRVLNIMGQVFEFAMPRRKCVADPTKALLQDLPTKRVTHHASLTTPSDIAVLLRDLEGYAGAVTTQAALKIAPYVFVRPGELRKAEWTEFDFNAAEWRIPPHRMKLRESHVVPLAKQVVALLLDLQRHTGNGKYLFPGIRKNGRPMSENTINAALRGLGYAADEMTGHGFRSTASTRLNEMGYRSDVIEVQLAHTERNGSRKSYNHAKYFAERRTMMQEWADYLDGLKLGATVIPIASKVA